LVPHVRKLEDQEERRMRNRNAGFCKLGHNGRSGTLAVRASPMLLFAPACFVFVYSFSSGLPRASRCRGAA